ncbi:dephospho-CoA kinase [Actinomyces sp. oral taxon 848 str. F0332]|nr:dephospho-CoA kinase [Actinomyces sp. oral taxon 848 str. F0332]
MLIVTLAGGIGSGKSTVAAALAECGARLLSLDDVARDVLSPGEEAVREVGDLWPEAVREGKIDRAALARIVFDDAAALARLNAVVHPRTWERAQAQLASWREESLQAQSAREFVVVVELALLAGSPYQDAYHGTIVVDAPEDVRVLRLVDSRGMDEADARARIASQTPASRVRELADVVVDNGGSLEDAARAARELWEGWLVPYAANMREGRRVFGGDAPPSPGQRARAAARLTRQGAFVNRESALGKGEAVPSRKGAEAALGGGGGETAGDKGGGVLEIVGPADESSLANAGFVPCAGELRAASQTYKSRRVSPDARRDASPGDSGDVASGSGNCAPGGPRLYVSADPRFAMAAVVTGEHD